MEVTSHRPGAPLGRGCYRGDSSAPGTPAGGQLPAPLAPVEAAASAAHDPPNFATPGEAAGADELAAAEEAEAVLRRGRMLRGLRGYFDRLGTLKGNYTSLFLFLLFIVYYLTLLFEQRNSFLAFVINAALSSVLPTDTATGEPLTSFSAADELYAWLEGVITQTWRDPQCGDGICEPPYEYPGFGRFGCKADCGPQEDVTRVSVHLTTFMPRNSAVDAAEQAEFLQETTYNLCTPTLVVNENEVCWWATPQKFVSTDQTVTHELMIPDGAWQLRVHAPYGGVKGNVTRTDSGAVLTSFDYCADRDPGQANATNGRRRRTLLTHEPGGSGLAGYTDAGGSVCTEQGYDSVWLAVEYPSEGFYSTEVFVQFTDTVTSEAVFTLSDSSWRGITAASLCLKSDRTYELTYADTLKDGWDGGALWMFRNDNACSVTDPQGLQREYGEQSETIPILLSDVSTCETPSVLEKYANKVAFSSYGVTGLFSDTSYRAVNGTCNAGGHMHRLSLDFPDGYLGVSYYLTAADGKLVKDFVKQRGAGLPVPYVEVSEWCLAAGTYVLEVAQAPAEYSGVVELTDSAGCSVAKVRLEKKIVSANATVSVTSTAPDPNCTARPIAPDAVTVGWQGCDAPKRVKMIWQTTFNQDDIQWRVWTATGTTTRKKGPMSLAGAARTFAPYSYAEVELCLNDTGGKYILGLFDDNSNVNELRRQKLGLDDNNNYFDPFFDSYYDPFGDYANEEILGSNGWDGAMVTLVDGENCFISEHTLQGDVATQLVDIVTPGTPMTAREPGTRPASCKTVDSPQNYCPFHVAVLDECHFADLTIIETHKFQMCEAVCANTACDDAAYTRNGFAWSGLGCCVRDSVDRVYRFEQWDYNPAGDLAYLPPVIPTLDESVSRKRFLGLRNRIVAGIFMYQKRAKSSKCMGDRFAHIFPVCMGSEASLEPYGADPVFLPSASLYSADMLPSKCCNESAYKPSCQPPACGDFYTRYDPVTNASNFNSRDVPLGFHAHKFSSKIPDSFPVFFDINLLEKRAKDLITYMKEGFFIDQNTQQIWLQAVTYNGELQYFANIDVWFTFSPGGNIDIRSNIQTVNVEMYEKGSDVARLIFELFFVIIVLYFLYQELAELYTAHFRKGSFLLYFKSVWNYVDLLSIGMNLSCIISWLVFQVTLALPFDVDVRYEVYSNLSAKGRFLHLAGHGSGLDQVAKKFSTVSEMCDFQTTYMLINGINVFLLLVRVLELCDFQPRMGIVTRTLERAASDLGHFIVLMTIMLMGYAMMGHLVFGTTLQSFSTLWNSVDGLFNMLAFQDNTVGMQVVALEGALFVPGLLFYWSFALLVVLILMNFFLTIVINAFADVKEKTGDAVSMPTEIFLFMKAWWAGRQAKLSSKRISDVLSLLAEAEGDKPGPTGADGEQQDQPDGGGDEVDLGDGVVTTEPEMRRALQAALASLQRAPQWESPAAPAVPPSSSFTSIGVSKRFLARADPAVPPSAHELDAITRLVAENTMPSTEAEGDEAAEEAVARHVELMDVLLRIEAKHDALARRVDAVEARR